MHSTPPIDHFDQAILAILQDNNKTPLCSISEQVNLSTASVQRRIKRMDHCGIIKMNSAILAPEKLGQMITLLVDVHLVRSQSEDIKKMEVIFSGPEVQQCYYIAGDADFLLVLTVPSMEAYKEISHRLFYNNPHVKWFRTTMVMQRIKTTLNIPIAPQEN